MGKNSSRGPTSTGSCNNLVDVACARRRKNIEIISLSSMVAQKLQPLVLSHIGL